MKTLMTIALLASALAAQAKTSTPAGWTDDYDAALRRAAAENKLVLADFSGSDWCGWCKKLDKEVFDTEEFRKGATNEYVLLMVDSPQDQGLLGERFKEHFAVPRNDSMINVGGSKVDIYGVRYRKVK